MALAHGRKAETMQGGERGTARERLAVKRRKYNVRGGDLKLERADPGGTDRRSVHDIWTEHTEHGDETNGPA